MNTAASPTKECIRAMNCGMPVICTRAARHRPIAAPTTIATRAPISPTSGSPRASSVRLATSASAMPAMP